MSLLSFNVPEVGQPDKTEDPKIANALTAILAWANGNVDSTNLAAGGVQADRLEAAALEALGLNTEATKRRGHAAVAAEQSRASAAYGTLATPDEVTVTLPADGLILVWYQAIWLQSVEGAARAALFLNGNQLVSGYSPSVQETGTAGASIAQTLSTSSEGLVNGAAATAGQHTTGQAVGGGNGGGPCCIFAEAGTYKVSVQFKASSGNVTAHSRKLWVEARGF